MANTSTVPSKLNNKIQPVTLQNEIVDGLDREEMISVAAYYHAENRGFDGGDQLADWLTAESEINAIHNNSKDIMPSKSKITPIAVPVS